MDQVKRRERGLAASFWLAMAGGGVPVPPGGGRVEVSEVEEMFSGCVCVCVGADVTGVAGAWRGAVLVVVGRGGKAAAGRLLRLVHRAAQHGPGEGMGGVVVVVGAGTTHESTEEG